jgi:hypothetical protein
MGTALLDIRHRPGHPPSHMTMDVETEAACPYCGQNLVLIIDTSTASQRFVTDCDVCCRPFEVLASCGPGEILSLDLRSD